MRQDTTKRDRRTNQGVEFFVTAYRELQVAGRDALHLEVFGRVASQLEDFGGQVFEDSGDVDGSCRKEEVRLKSFVKGER